MMMTDKDQKVVWEGEFLPFGEAYSITGTVSNNFRFPGQYYDEETGLHQNWHRDYKPELGRYLEKDPIGFDGGINLYAYISNNPIRYIDRLGLDNVGCDWIPDSLETPCRLECCAKHDECFDKNKCSASSWVKTCSKKCDQCNDEVKKCFLKCKSSDADDPNKSNYYCAKLHKYVNIPGDFKDYKTAKKYCGSN